jgi:hypothetical protein
MDIVAKDMDSEKKMWQEVLKTSGMGISGMGILEDPRVKEAKANLKILNTPEEINRRYQDYLQTLNPVIAKDITKKE